MTLLTQSVLLSSTFNLRGLTNVPRRYFCVWRHPPVQHFQIQMVRLRFVRVCQLLLRTRVTRCLVVSGHHSVNYGRRIVSSRLTSQRNDGVSCLFTTGPDVASASTRLTTPCVAFRKHLSFQGPCVYKGVSCRLQLANSPRFSQVEEDHVVDTPVDSSQFPPKLGSREPRLRLTQAACSCFLLAPPGHRCGLPAFCKVCGVSFLLS